MEELCPFCHKAPVMYIHRGVSKCRRQMGGCGKIFKADAIKVKKPPHTIIKCVACGDERAVKKQDAFQVKRCVPCQKLHRAKSRKHDPTRNK